MNEKVLIVSLGETFIEQILLHIYKDMRFNRVVY